MAYRYAWLYIAKEDNTSAFDYNRQSIEAYATLKDSQMVAESYRQQAYIHENMDSLDNALNALRTGLQFIDTVNNPSVGVICNIYSNMTDVFVKKHQYDSALVYANALLETKARRFPTYYIGSIFDRFLRAEVYAAMHRYKEALADYNASISDMLTYYKDAPAQIAISYRNRGDFFRQIGEIDKAITDYQTAIDYFKKDSSSPIVRITSLEERIQELKEK